MAQATETPKGFGLSGKRTVIELAVVAVALVLLFLVGRAAIGCVAEDVAEGLPLSVDEKIGAAAAEEMRAKYSAAGDQPTPKQVERVERIFGALRGALTDADEQVLVNPRVTVVVDETVNAFALPGGEVFVLTGLLDRVGDDDGLLFGVLAHELGHAVRRHGVRMLARRAAFGVVLALIVGNTDDSVTALVAGASELDGLAHSRSMETEADEFGVDLLRRAGRDPTDLARFLETLGAQPVPQLLSTHPDPVERAAVIRERAR